MSDVKNVYFRNSLSGYNKSDVNEYLVRISGEFNEREAALRERAERAEKELLRLEDERSDWQNKNEELALSIDEYKNELQKLSSEKSELEEKLAVCSKEAADDYEKRICEQEAVIAKQFEEIDSLRRKLEEAEEKLECCGAENERYEELSRKAQLYEKTSANIGEAIISANKTAEEIIASAKEEARIISEKSQNELDEKRIALEESTRCAVKSIFAKLTAAASENRREIEGASSYLHQVFDKAIVDITVRNENVLAKLKNYEDGLWRSIKSDLESVSNEKCDEKKQQMKKFPQEQIKRFKK
ncbi:MAG: hypothetical protein IJ303_05825 [Clostridia bacterium]|nr:hypothetical protein [Clostridia bacterium]